MQKFIVLATISSIIALCSSPSIAATLGGIPDASSVFTTGGDITVPINPTFDPMTAPTTGVTVPEAGGTVDPVITNALGTLNTISGIVNNPSSAWGLLLGQANAPSAFTTNTLTTAILGSNVFNLDPKTQGIAWTIQLGWVDAGIIYPPR